MCRILLQKDTLTPLRQAQRARLPLCHRYRKGRTSRKKRAQVKLLQGKFIHMAWSPEISCALEHWWLTGHSCSEIAVYPPCQ